jgi:hypothetical protein
LGQLNLRNQIPVPDFEKKVSFFYRVSLADIQFCNLTSDTWRELGPPAGFHGSGTGICYGPFHSAAVHGLDDNFDRLGSGEKPYDNGCGCNDQDQNNPADISAIHQVTPFGFAKDSPFVFYLTATQTTPSFFSSPLIFESAFPFRVQVAGNSVQVSAFFRVFAYLTKNVKDVAKNDTL